MKAALIAEWLDPWRGGAETSTVQFIDHLVDLGVELDVFTRSRTPSRPGLRVHSILSSGGRGAFATVAFCRRADEAVSESVFDVVHAISPSRAADIYQPRGGTYAESIRRNLALRNSRSGRALKRLSQRLNIKRRALLRIEHRMLTGPEPPLVVALSDYVVRQLKEHYGLADDRIRKVFNGVDVEKVDEETRARHRAEIRRLYEIGDDELLALVVAHNFKLKGVHRWIDALSLLARDGGTPIRSLVVGKDRLIRWQRLVERRGLSGQLHFAGPTQRVQAFFHAADFLVHPTFYDPCSRVVLEALATGLPCVTTRFDGASEVVVDGLTGYVVDSPEDVAGLAEKVRRLSDKPTRAAMRAATDGLEGRISMRRHAEEMLALYEAVRIGAGRS